MAAGQLRCCRWIRQVFTIRAQRLGSLLSRRTAIFQPAAGISNSRKPALTEAQKHQYESEGYLIVKDVFDKEHIQKLKNTLDECEERARFMTKSTESFVLDPLHTPANPILQRVFLQSLVNPVFEETFRYERLVDIVSELIGPNVRFLRQDKLNFKQPKGSRFPVKWHQDWAFYPYTNKNVVVPSLAIDDCTKENGCLQVIPKSNNGPLYSHFTNGKFSAAINDNRLDPSSAVHLEVPSGGVSFHNIFTVHGSAENHSNYKRRLLVLQYCSTDAWPLLGVLSNTSATTGPVDWDLFKSTLVRGDLTMFPRMESLPLCIPIPFDNTYVLDKDGRVKSSHENPK